MNREQLAHVLRAAAQLVQDPDIVVLGSQAILGSYSEGELPVETIMSMEADLAFRDDADERKSDQVDGLIGEDSQFHATYAYYAQGVSIATATLPTGWEERVVPYDRRDADPSRAVCVDAHDLVLSKLVAGREKDFEFTTSLLRAELVDEDVLLERAGDLPVPGGVVQRVRTAVVRCARRARSS